MWVGVGSVCKRNTNIMAIWMVLDAIKDVRPDLRLHGFGLKKTSLQEPIIRDLLYSADSMAWSFAARREGRNANDWREAKAFIQGHRREDHESLRQPNLFLLSKAERYYFDQSAITEAATVGDNARTVQDAVPSHMPGVSPHAGIRRSGNKERKPASARGVPVDTGGRTSGAVAGSVPWEGDTRNKRSVWTVTTQPFKEAHFATFPPALIEPCILAGCPAGGTVLDPFGGAGTTGLVADRHGRDAILIELNPEYAEMARKRIFNDSPLFAEVS
jgi:hypothetical protein